MESCSFIPTTNVHLHYLLFCFVVMPLPKCISRTHRDTRTIIFIFIQRKLNGLAINNRNVVILFRFAVVIVCTLVRSFIRLCLGYFCSVLFCFVSCSFFRVLREHFICFVCVRVCVFIRFFHFGTDKNRINRILLVKLILLTNEMPKIVNKNAIYWWTNSRNGGEWRAAVVVWRRRKLGRIHSFLFRMNFVIEKRERKRERERDGTVKAAS